jgi:hypothetical protein
MAKVYSSRSTVHLLKDEAGGLMMETGITTITFYKGTFNAASAALRAQFAEVVKANPWLAGRLIKSRSGTQLQFPAEGVSEGLVSAMFASHAFQEGANAKDGALFLPAPERGYEAICTEMYRSGTMIVESGSALLGKDKPVALLTLAESKAGEFALVFSLSHSVGDGRTYYEVLKMLAPGSAVRKLSAARVQAFSEAMRGACGREALAWVEVVNNSITDLNVITLYISHKIFCNMSAEPRCHGPLLAAHARVREQGPLLRLRPGPLQGGGGES